MAVTNNVDSNVQNQLIEEQIRQQQVQQQTQVNDINNQTANQEATNNTPTPIDPATNAGTATKLAEINQQAGLIKANLNDKVIVVASTNQTPPVDTPTGDSVIGKLTQPATLKNTEFVDINLKTTEDLLLRRTSLFDRLDESTLTAEQAIQDAMGGGLGHSGSPAKVIYDNFRTHDFNEDFISDVFQKLGSKGTATVLSDTSYGSNQDLVETVDKMRQTGKFNQGDMFQLAKAALETPTVHRDGKTSSQIANEQLAKENAGELGKDFTWKDKGWMGVSNYTTTGISNLDKAFQNASPELKGMWEKGLGDAIFDKINKPVLIASTGEQRGSYPSQLNKLLEETQSLEDRVATLMNLSKPSNITENVNKNLPFESDFLAKTLSIIEKRADEYPAIKATINSMADSVKDDVQFTGFVDNLLSGTRNFGNSGFTGKGLGDFFGKIANGSARFASGAHEMAQKVRSDKNFGENWAPHLVDATLAAITPLPRKDFQKVLNENDYKDLAKLGDSLPDFVDRIKGNTDFNDLGKALFFNVGKNLDESFLPKSDSLRPAEQGLANYLLGNPINIAEDLNSVSANPTSPNDKTQIFRKVLTETVFKSEENTKKFFNEAYPKVFGNYLTSAVESGIDGKVSKVNIPDQFEGFLMATEKAIKSTNKKIENVKEKAKEITEVASFILFKKFPAVKTAIEKQKKKFEENIPEPARKPIEKFIKENVTEKLLSGLSETKEGNYLDLKDAMKFSLKNLINFVDEVKVNETVEKSEQYEDLTRAYNNLLALELRLKNTTTMRDESKK